MLAWHHYLFGLLFILAGANHFRKPKLYLRIMPNYVPMKGAMVQLSGIAEMVLGFMILNPDTQSIAAWSIMVLLVLFIPVHVHMLQNEKASLNLPKWVLIIRFPLQFGLMYWAHLYI